jgi:ABC-type Zn uptake system ZnuABC Zn-binding protein ZnuA
VRRASALPGLTFGLAAAEGVLGLYLALCFDLPAGAAIAGVAGVTFLAVAAGAAYRAARPAPRLAATMVLVALGAVVLAGCGSSSSSSSSDEEALKIVATTPQIADIVRNVGGDAVKVTQILPPGADPHEYEPKPSAVAAIADADIVFRSGGDVDAWLAPAVKAAGGDATQVDLSRAAVLLPAQAGADGADDKNFNAHWYLAPDNVIRASSRTRDELIKADPEARETFRANAAAYSALATDAQTALTKCSNRVPDADRKLLAGHNDFNYLANAFGFEIAAQLAENGEAEPSASDLQTAVDDARAADVTALVASKGEVTALAEQTASKLNIPLLQLYADSLTKSGVASTLLGAIGYDVAKIVDATSGGKVSCPSSK